MRKFKQVSGAKTLNAVLRISLDRKVINLKRTFTTDHGFSGALIVGITDNMSKKLELELLKVLNSIEAILPTSALIIASDSSGQGQGILEDPSNPNPKIQYLRSKHDVLPRSDISKSRVLRNMYVQAIRKDPAFTNYELIVVVDLDGSNTRITESAFRSALDSAFQWDALAANQLGKYRDIESLRHEYWSPNNCMREFRWLKSFINENQAWENAVKSRMIRISAHEPPISVDSAFGGLCIYKRWIFEEFDYDSDRMYEDSENSHVTLNRKAKAGGARIFIHPELINSNGRHLHFLQKEFTRQLKLRAHSFPFTFLLPFLRGIRNSLQKQ